MPPNDAFAPREVVVKEGIPNEFIMIREDFYKKSATVFEALYYAKVIDDNLFKNMIDYIGTFAYLLKRVYGSVNDKDKEQINMMYKFLMEYPRNHLSGVPSNIDEANNILRMMEFRFFEMLDKYGLNGFSQMINI